MKSKVVEIYEQNQNRILNSGLNIVDNKKWNDRLGICKKCEYYEMYEKNQNVFKCKKCGCPGFKFLLSESKCPINKPKWR
jgi:Zn-finger protein